MRLFTQQITAYSYSNTVQPKNGINSNNLQPMQKYATMFGATTEPAKQRQRYRLTENNGTLSQRKKVFLPCMDVKFQCHFQIKRNFPCTEGKFLIFKGSLKLVLQRKHFCQIHKKFTLWTKTQLTFGRVKYYNAFSSQLFLLIFFRFSGFMKTSSFVRVPALL